MSEVVIKSSNLFKCTGEVDHKQYNEETKELRFRLKVFTEKKTVTMDSPYKYYRDYPGFYVEGDKAAEMNEKFAIGDRVYVKGRLEELDNMVHVEKNLYRKDRGLRLVADEIIVRSNRPGGAYVDICGDVVWTHTLTEKGPTAYLVVLKIPFNEKKPAYVMFSCFFSNTGFIPEKGDHLRMKGKIQTRVEETKTRDGKRRLRNIPFLIAKRVSKE